MASWEESKKIGENFENYLSVQLSEKLGVDVIINDIVENYKYYDLIIINLGITIECKYDLKAIETGNICIECSCDDNLSGISTTKADYWIICDGVDSYFIKTSEIKKCIDECYTSLYPNEPTKILLKKKCAVEQSDKTYKLMDLYIISKKIFIKYCSEVNKIDEMNYDELKEYTYYEY